MHLISSILAENRACACRKTQSVSSIRSTTDVSDAHSGDSQIPFTCKPNENQEIETFRNIAILWYLQPCTERSSRSARLRFFPFISASADKRFLTYIASISTLPQQTQSTRSCRRMGSARRSHHLLSGSAVWHLSILVQLCRTSNLSPSISRNSSSGRPLSLYDGR